jgi:tRNA(adenine34) deaminase
MRELCSTNEPMSADPLAAHETPRPLIRRAKQPTVPETEQQRHALEAPVAVRSLDTQSDARPDIGATDMVEWMRLALAQAQLGLDAGEAPIGCVLLRGDGSVASAAHNSVHGSGNPIAHAEMNAFSGATGQINPDDGLILVSTLEPCVMCTGAAMQVGVRTIIFGLSAPADSGTQRVRPPSSPSSTAPHVIGGVAPDESRRLFQGWLTLHRGDESRAEQREFIEQLLELTE